MKLRLDPKEKLPTLEVSESLSPADVAVLRAGIRKLFKSGKKEVLLDLSPVPSPLLATPEMTQALKSLQCVASEETGLLVLISSVPGIGSATSRAEALAVFDSPLARLINRQNQLQASLEILEAEKKVAEEKLAGLAPPEEALRERRRNSELKIELKQLSSEIENWLKTRPAKPLPRPTDPKRIRQAIQLIFKNQEVLK